MLLQVVRGPSFENLRFKPGGMSVVIGITDWQVVYLGYTHVLNAAGQYLIIPQTFIQLCVYVCLGTHTGRAIARVTLSAL